MRSADVVPLEQCEGDWLGLMRSKNSKAYRQTKRDLKKGTAARE